MYSPVVGTTEFASKSCSMLLPHPVLDHEPVALLFLVKLDPMHVAEDHVNSVVPWCLQ